MTASDRSDPVLSGLDGILADLEDFYKDLHANRSGWWVDVLRKRLT